MGKDVKEKDKREVVDIGDLELDGQSRAMKEAMSFTIGKGLPIPKNWSGEDLEKLEFPNDLSRLSIDQLGDLMGVWSSVMAYAQFEVARADVERTASGNKYDFEKKKIYLQLTARGGMNEEQRKAEVTIQTAKLQADYEVVRAKYTILRALLGSYSKYYQALSRELSRRGISGMGSAPVEYEEDDFERERVETKKRWA